MAKILIIEDEESILMPLEDNLRLEGYEVSSARDGERGLTLAASRAFDLIVLDIMLPKLDGFEVCKRLRQDRVMTPILMLTAKSQEVDKVLGLELGADDFVTKPFSSRELLARVKAILRRASEPLRGIDFVRFGDIELDFVKYEAKKGGRPVPLTALEFSLLHYLVQNKGRVVNRNEILDSVWGKDVYADARPVDKHISLLRKKFEDDPRSRNTYSGSGGSDTSSRDDRCSRNLHGRGAKHSCKRCLIGLSSLMEIKHEEARRMKPKAIVFFGLALVVAFVLAGAGQQTAQQLYKAGLYEGLTV